MASLLTRWFIGILDLLMTDNLYIAPGEYSSWSSHLSLSRANTNGNRLMYRTSLLPSDSDLPHITQVFDLQTRLVLLTKILVADLREGSGGWNPSNN